MQTTNVPCSLLIKPADCATPKRRRQRVFAEVRRGLSMIALLSLVLLAGSQAACRKKVSQEERVRRVVRDVAQAANARDMKKILTPLSQDFALQRPGDDDKISRKELKMFLFRYLRQEPSPQALIRSIDVEVKQSQANAKVMTLIGQGPKSLANWQTDIGRVEALQLDLKLHLEDQDWKVDHCAYSRIDPRRLILAE